MRPCPRAWDKLRALARQGHLSSGFDSKAWASTTKQAQAFSGTGSSVPLGGFFATLFTVLGLPAGIDNVM